MATSEVVQWKVFVVVEEDDSLTGTYRMAPDTRLSELMQVWMDNFQLLGHWAFKSADGKVAYRDNSETLQMIGETVPRARIVTLRAELSDAPRLRSTIEIIVFLNDTCRHFSVKPNEKLYRIMGQLPGKPKCFEYNGLPLNLKDTVQQAGLRNKAVIHESLCSVTVKLSSGESVFVKLPSDSIVLHLKEKVKVYETDDFFFKYQGRYLRSDESIDQLKQDVEVSTEEFVVSVNERRVCWRTKDAPIPVSDFVSQLAVKGNMETKELEMLEFVCVGCQRHLRIAEDDIQQLPVECCKEKSLNLVAMAHSDNGTNLRTNDTVKHIQNFHQQLVQHSSNDPRAATFRCMCKEMKDKFAEERVDYNVLIQCSNSLLKRINELEHEIKIVVETFIKEKAESQKKIECLQVKNVKSEEEINALKEDNKKLTEENNKMYDQLGVKLFVTYHPDYFSPASRPEVESRGRYPLNKSWSYIKCQVPGIRPGSISFEEGRAVLQRLFTRGQIVTIGQVRGVVAGREVARVTSVDDELVAYTDSPYCDIGGTQHSWEEAGKPDGQSSQAGDRVFICGGRRRTALVINT